MRSNSPTIQGARAAGSAKRNDEAIPGNLRSEAWPSSLTCNPAWDPVQYTSRWRLGFGIIPCADSEDAPISFPRAISLPDAMDRRAEAESAVVPGS
jgi:hypothetical protein